jgi:hypothetical protein
VVKIYKNLCVYVMQLGRQGVIYYSELSDLTAYMPYGNALTISALYVRQCSIDCGLRSVYWQELHKLHSSVPMVTFCSGSDDDSVLLTVMIMSNCDSSMLLIAFVVTVVMVSVCFH